MKVFTRYSYVVQNHCLFGNHTYQLQARSSYDIKMRCRDACCTLLEDTLKYFKTVEGITEQVCVCVHMVWALKKERKSARFSDDRESYLSDIFLQGENGGASIYSLVVTKTWELLRMEMEKKDSAQIFGCWSKFIYF